jgi:peptidylprolyl isomerase
VQVRYTGWTADGKTLRSPSGPEPLTLHVPVQADGWYEGLLQMVAGETRRMWIPAPDSRGTVVMDLELLNLIPRPKPPPAPRDVAVAPRTARRTASGIAYEILSSDRRGGRRPGPGDAVAFNHTSFSPDGTLMESSYIDGRPLSCPMADLLAAWREALQLLRVGDKARFWFPERPKGEDDGDGPSVSDFELLAVYPLPARPQAPR